MLITPQGDQIADTLFAALEDYIAAAAAKGLTPFDPATMPHLGPSAPAVNLPAPPKLLAPVEIVGQTVEWGAFVS